MNETYSKIKQLKLVLFEGPFLKDDRFKTGMTSLVAIKDNDSFMVANSTQGYKLVQDNQVLSQQDFSCFEEKGSCILDILYIKSMDIYLLGFPHGIYKKEINQKPLQLFSYISVIWTYQPKMRYSKLINRVVITDGKGIFLSLNPKTKKIEARSKRSFVCFGGDFRLFGQNEDKILSVFCDGEGENNNVIYAAIHTFMSTSKIRGPPEVAEFIIKQEYHLSPILFLSVCPKNKFAVIGISSIEEQVRQELKILGLEGDQKLKCITNFQLQDSVIHKLISVDAFVYVDDHLLILCADYFMRGEFRVICYDSSKNLVSALDHARVKHGSVALSRMDRLGRFWFYASSKGNLMRLVISL